MKNKQAQNLSSIHKISIYFSLRNKFFRWIEEALFHTVGQVDIFSMSLHQGLNGSQKNDWDMFYYTKAGNSLGDKLETFNAS